MKFKYKVLFTNIILLSIGLGIAGFLIIRNNYRSALEAQIKAATETNNYMQNSIECRLLETVKEYKLPNFINGIAKQTYPDVPDSGSAMYVFYNYKCVYQSSEIFANGLNDLIDSTSYGQKKYLIVENENHHYIYVASCSLLNESFLHVVTQSDITDVYDNVRLQNNYLIILMSIIIIVDSIAMYIICFFLLRPLEKLNKMSKKVSDGDYDERVVVKSGDEIGELADTFNVMADSVEDHIKELNDLVARQDQFVADFTHEIKTPMTSIMGYADTIRSRDLPRETEIMAASYIFNEGKRLEAICRKLFDFIYTKQYGISPVKTSVKKVMSDVTESIRPNAEKKNITINTVTKDLYINGDSDLLKSAFINLSDNAIKASAEGDTIDFIAESDDSFVSVSVIDRGIGIPEEHLSKICDEFYTVNKSRSRQEGGAGLGLSLAALVFKCHDADFHIESKQGEGTTMTVKFKLFADEEEVNKDAEG